MKNFPLSNFVDWATNAQADFVALSVRDQIIVYALLVAITVLSLAITYWAVKGSLALTYWAVKGSLYVTYYSVILSLLIPLGLLKLTIELAKSAFPKPVLQAPQPTAIPTPVAVPDREIHQHCPQCGKEFSNAMEEAMHKNGATFCESCGVKAEIRA